MTWDEHNTAQGKWERMFPDWRENLGLLNAYHTPLDFQFQSLN